MYEAEVTVVVRELDGNIVDETAVDVQFDSDDPRDSLARVALDSAARTARTAERFS